MKKILHIGACDPILNSYIIFVKNNFKFSEHEFLLIDANDVPLIRTLLKGLVPGYQPEGDVVDWVHLANNPTNTTSP